MTNEPDVVTSRPWTLINYERCMNVAQRQQPKCGKRRSVVAGSLILVGSLVLAITACGSASSSVREATTSSIEAPPTPATALGAPDANAVASTPASVADASREQGHSGGLVDEGLLAFDVGSVSVEKIDGPAGSVTMQGLLASRSMLWLDNNAANVASAAVVEVYGPVDDERVGEMFGPFEGEVARRVDGASVLRSWYGLVWKEGSVAVAVRGARGEPDLLEIAAGLSAWNGATIEFDVEPRGAELLPSHPGLPVDRGPAFVTVYGDAQEQLGPQLIVTIVDNPAESALGRLVDPSSEIVGLDGQTMTIHLPPPVGSTDAPSQLVWDLPDGSQATIFMNPRAGGRVALDDLLAVARSLVRVTDTEWRAAAR